jgi:hypothetical protein
MCFIHDSPLIRSVARYGVLCNRGLSTLDQNILFCTKRYHRSIDYVIYSSVDGIASSFACNSIDDETHKAANLLTETLMLRDKVLNFPDGFSMTFHELNEIINYI